MTKKRIILFTLAVVAIGLVGYGYVKNSRNPTEILASTTPSKVSFSVESISGGKIDLADYKGKVVLVDFWATWCPPCVASVPDLITLRSEFQSQGFEVIGLTMDEDLSQVPPFTKKYKVTYPIGIATAAEIEQFGGIEGIPTLFILDREHNVVQKLVGYQDPKALREAIQPLL